MWYQADILGKRFQSTPLREGRPLFNAFGSVMYLFQSTPLREGRLWLSHSYHSVMIVSIHAPARGATRKSL